MRLLQVYNNIVYIYIYLYQRSRCIFLKEFKQSNDRKELLRLEIIEFRVNRPVIYRNYLLYFIFIVT